MQTRTRLTTPPGDEPAPHPSERDSSGRTTSGEAYVHGLALPTEPRVPGRYRRLWIASTVLVVVLIAAWAALQVVTAGEDFDPAVGENPGGTAPTQLPDGGEGSDG